MEAIRHVDRHVGSSQLLEGLPIQNQEERSLILKQNKGPFSGMLLELPRQMAFLLFLALRSRNGLMKSSLIKFHLQNQI